MKLFYIILISLLCCEARADETILKCKDISYTDNRRIYKYDFLRCENNEVICYQYFGSSHLSCKFK